VLVMSLGLVSSLAVAGSTVRRDFSCVTPWVGSTRCGSEDANLRIGSKCTVEVLLKKSEGNATINFHVTHAVSGDALSVPLAITPLGTEVEKECKDKNLSEEDCRKEEDKRAKLLWTNPKDSNVDVYLSAASASASFRKQIAGRVIVKCP
jgi:hypothetical protein